MPTESRRPIMRSTLTSVAGAFLSWTAIGTMGALYIRNRGPNDVFVTIFAPGDAVPAAGALPKAIANGTYGLQMNESLNLDDIVFDQVGVACAGVNTGTVEAVGVQRPGNGGQGAG